MSTFGKIIEVNLFGESHGEYIGIVINNLPSGIELDLDNIENELSKRRPKSDLSTSRREKDEYKIIGGYYNNHTTGTPLTIMIPNQDKRSSDYNPEVLRPSHADYTSHIKYNGYEDYRGSGHFSGRLTTPLVILGAISIQLLRQKDIIIGSHIASIKDIKDKDFCEINDYKELLKSLNTSDFPVIHKDIIHDYKKTILDAKDTQNSVGGVVETMILGLSPGYGNPFFDSIESTLAHLLFSIPAVKGVEFGKGFGITKMFGSEANDEFYIDNDKIKTRSNNSGGIQGGISNGMPITFKTAIKPTASIGKLQKTVNRELMEETTISLVGRHDPAIVHRVVHVINAITAYATLEIICRSEGLTWIK